jgi:hypothetical protein
VLEIKGNVQLAQVYVAEFIRLYNHYLVRALWDKSHPDDGEQPKDDVFVLERTRDEWAKRAYTDGTKEFLARTRGL